MSQPTKFSKVQIVLHWGVLLLFLGSFFSHEAMKDSWRDLMRNGTTDGSIGTQVHVIVGIVILALAIWRLALRHTKPQPAEVGSGLQALLAKVVKIGLYVVMLVLPLSGMAAWFGGVRDAGEVHEVMFNLGLLLVGLHVAAALFHQFVLKDNLMARMKLR